VQPSLLSKVIAQFSLGTNDDDAKSDSVSPVGSELLPPMPDLATVGAKPAEIPHACDRFE